MARGDTQPPPRKHFSEQVDHPTDDERAKRVRYRCQANGCPMPGGIFPGGHDGLGVCAWHYATHASDWPRITQTLNDWRCVSSEINDARRVLTHPDLCIDAKAQDKAFRAAWKRLEPALEMGGWFDELRPAKGESYGGWSKRLELFLSARVSDVLRAQIGRSA